MPPVTVDSALTSALTGLPRGAPRPAPPEVTPLAMSPLRAVIGPVALMTATPVLSLLFFVAVLQHDGSLLALLRSDPALWGAQLPRPSWWAALVLVGWTVFQLVLLRFLPGPVEPGPVTPHGQRPQYRLNGVLAWIVTHAALLVAWRLGIFKADALYARYGELLATLLVFAFAFCGFLHWKGRRFPSTPDAVVTGRLAFDFFQGIELHPRLLGIQLKQLINCRVSMMGWSVVFVLCALAQIERHGALSTSMAASVIVLVAYLFKFFVWESGYFASMDIQHDRFGFYICWGVLVWVPAVYCLPALWLVDHPIALSLPHAAGIVALGLLSIGANYQADAQQQRVRATHGQTTVWGKPPELIPARWTTSEGETRDTILLASGWWGLARHIHYVPELLLAAAWTLPAGFTHFLPWFYWIFLFILLMDRAVRDEKRCAEKYGAAWVEYTRRVPWRVLPGVW